MVLRLFLVLRARQFLETRVNSFGLVARAKLSNHEKPFHVNGLFWVPLAIGLGIASADVLT
jgi:hypothetical protein